MRKTRLVILPTKCLHQIGFLLLFLSCPVIGDWGRIRPESENLHRSIQIQREGTCGLQRDSPVRLLDKFYSNQSDQCKIREFNDNTKRVTPIIFKSNAQRLEQMSVKRRNIRESQRRVTETRKDVENFGRSVVRRDMRSAPRSKNVESRLLFEKRSLSMEQRQNENARLMTVSRLNDRKSNISQKIEGRNIARLPPGGRTIEQEKGERVQNRRHFRKEERGENEKMVRAVFQRRNNNRQVKKMVESTDFKRDIERQQKNSKIQNRFVSSRRRVEREDRVSPERRERNRELKNNESLKRREERFRIFELQKGIEKENERRDKRKLVREATERSIVNLHESIKNERVFQTVLKDLIRTATGNEGQEIERMRQKTRERNSYGKLSEVTKEQRRVTKNANLFRNLMLRKELTRTWRTNIRREIETTRFLLLLPTGEVSDKQGHVGRLKITREKLGLDDKANENEYFGGFFKWTGLDNYNHLNSKAFDWTTNCVVGAFAYFLTSRKAKAV